MAQSLNSISCTACHCEPPACYCDHRPHEHVVDEHHRSVTHFATTCDEPEECWRPAHFCRLEKMGRALQSIPALSPPPPQEEK